MTTLQIITIKIMCGIIYLHRKDKASIPLWKRYLAQKRRGSDGFGYVAINKDFKTVTKRFTKEKEIEEALQKCESEAILFHHRFPTSTENFAEVAHPIAVSLPKSDCRWQIVHNGIINNCDELKPEHEKLGIKYKTEIEKEVTYKVANKNYVSTELNYNDSESFAIDLALVLEGRQQIMKARGSIAFIALKINKSTGKLLTMYYGRNEGNPLMTEINNDFFCLRSEGGQKSIKDDMLYTFDYQTGETSETYFQVGYYHNYTRYPMGYKTNAWENDRDLSLSTYNYTKDDLKGAYKKPSDGSKMYNDLIEEKMELEEMIDQLEAEERSASRKEDYDLQVELMEDIEELKEQLASLENQLEILDTM